MAPARRRRAGRQNAVAPSGIDDVDRRPLAIQKGDAGTPPAASDGRQGDSALPGDGMGTGHVTGSQGHKEFVIISSRQRPVAQRRMAAQRLFGFVRERNGFDGKFEGDSGGIGKV